MDFYYQYYGDFNFYEMKADPWLKFMSIPDEMVKSRWDSRLDFVRECIENDWQPPDAPARYARFAII